MQPNDSVFKWSQLCDYGVVLVRKTAKVILTVSVDDELHRHVVGLEREGHRKRALIALLNKTSTGDETLSIEVERDHN